MAILPIINGKKWNPAADPYVHPSQKDNPMAGYGQKVTQADYWDTVHTAKGDIGTKANPYKPKVISSGSAGAIPQVTGNGSLAQGGTASGTGAQGSSSGGIVASQAPAGGLSTEFKAAPTYSAGKGQTYEVTQNELVAKQLDNLLAKNGPYLQRARYLGLASMAPSGLVNSTMSASAGEAAAYDAALSVAQPDASTYANRGQAREEGIISSYLQGQKDTNTAGLYGVQAGYESILSKQDAAQKSALQAQIDASALGRQTQSETHEQTMQKAQLASQEKLQNIQDQAQMLRQKQAEGAQLTLQEKQDLAALDRQKLSVNAEVMTQQMNIDAEKYLKSLGITAEAQADLIESTRVMGQEYLVAYKSILMDPNMDSEESRATALKRLTEVYETNMDLVAAVAEVKTSSPNPNTAGAVNSPASAIINRADLGIDYSTEDANTVGKTGKELWNSTDTMTADVALEKFKAEKSIPINVNIDASAAARGIEKGLSYYGGKKTFQSWVNIFNAYAAKDGGNTK